jgi:hypothetical protein
MDLHNWLRSPLFRLALKGRIHPLMNGDALVLTLLYEVRVTDQSTLLVVNQIVPETGRQPLFYVCHLCAQTGVNPNEVVSRIKAKVDVSGRIKGVRYFF